MSSLLMVRIRGLPNRVRASFMALTRLLYFKPQYALLALAASIIFYELIFWLLNIGLAQYLVSSQTMSLGDKVDLVIGSYLGIFSLPLSPMAMVLFAISLLQGIAIAGLVYISKIQREMQQSLRKELGGTGVAGLLSVLGLGCAACGTSLVTPLLTFFFASSTYAVADVVGFYAAIIGLAIALVTVHLIGHKLSLRLRL